MWPNLKEDIPNAHVVLHFMQVYSYEISHVQNDEEVSFLADIAANENYVESYATVHKVRFV